MILRDAWLAFLNTITKVELTLATPLRNTNLDSPNDYRQNPQAYETIIIAFHLGVFWGIVIYIFLKEGKVFVSSIGINMITYLHEGS
jgi:hypothetical protein